MATASIPIKEKHKLTIIMDGITSKRLDALSDVMEMNRTEVLRRAIRALEIIMAKRKKGEELFIVDRAGKQTPLVFDETDSVEDSRKVTLMFSHALMARVNSLGDEMDLYTTYVFRRAVSLFYTLYTDSQSADECVHLLNPKTGKDVVLYFV